MLAAGDRVRDYEVMAPLKAGGMAALFLARRVGPQGFVRPVVIKVVHPHLAEDPELVERFLDEARLSAAIQHPNVVHVEELGVSHGRYFLAMEYLPGESLSALLTAVIHAARRLDPAVATHVARAAAAGLHAAHETRDGAGAGLGIVHRDISPQNLLVSVEGHVKVIDFGVAKADAGPVRVEGLVGKVAYMSPEQARGAPVDRRTDVYALGVVLWEMLTLRRRFTGTGDALLAAVRDPRPVPPSACAPVPPELDAVVLRATAADPQDRYPTCEALERALADAAPDSADAGPALARQVRELLGERIEARRRAVAGGASTERREVPAAEPPAGGRSEDGTRRAREAHRRQVTMVACAVDDTPDAPELLRSVTQALRRFGGVVVATTADGLLACFGYPVAHEDAAARAVDGALAARDGAPPGALRAGVHTGPVVAGDPSGEGGGEVSVLGEARDLALELEGGAPRGAVVVSGATWRRVEGQFDGVALGATPVRVASRPVERFRVDRTRARRTRIELTAGLSPLVGREREVGLLLDRWEQAKEEQGQVVLLVGEPGIGKSRLTFVLRERVDRERDGGAVRTVVEWRCSALHRESSLHPAAEWLERHLRLRREEPAEARFERLERWAREEGLGAEDARIVAALLGLPLPARVPPLALTPDRLRRETLRVWSDWVRGCAERGPVLFVVEDLHWVDATTLDLLRGWVAERAGERVLLLLTFRPEWRPPWSDPRITQVPLQRLTRRQVGEMLAHGAAGGLPPEVAERVAARSDGVPLFVEECTRALLETGLLRREGDRLVAAGPLPANAVPASLQDLLTARLDRLGDASEVARLGAVLGREFSHAVLAAVAGGAPEALDAALTRLLDAELLVRKGRAPHHTYTFRHALIQDAAYTSLLKGRREELHLRVAEVLQDQFPEVASATPEVVAHHFTAARLPARAVPHWAAAGARSRDRSANLEAIGHFERALALLGPLPDSPEKDAQELALQLQLGTAYLSAKGYAAPEGGPIFARARALAERSGAPAQRFAVLWGTWAWRVVRGEFRHCLSLADEAMASAVALADPGILAEALFLPGLTRLYRGDFEGSRSHCARAVSRLDDRASSAAWRVHTGQDSGVTHRSYLALAEWHLGSPDRALERGREAVALARGLEHPYSLVYALHHLGWLYEHCRMGAEAEAAGEETQQISRAHCFALFEITGGLYRAAGRLHQGRAAEALPDLRAGIVAYQATGAALALPYYLSLRAEAERRTGDPGAALDTVAEALRIADAHEDWFHVAELHRLRGELLGPARAAEAEAALRTSLDVARRQQGQALQLRTTTSLARLWARLGRSDQARRALEDGIVGPRTADRADAEALLDALRRGEAPAG